MLSMLKPVGRPNSSNLVEDVDARPLCEANHQVVEVSLATSSLSDKHPQRQYTMSVSALSASESVAPQTGGVPRSDLGRLPLPPKWSQSILMMASISAVRVMIAKKR